MRLLILLACLPVLSGASTSIAAPAPRAIPRPVKVDPLLEELQRDLSRFPSREECRFWIEYAARHLRWIEVRQRFFPAEAAQWREYAWQVSQWRDIWVGLENAQAQHCDVTFRRQQLEDVRDAIGEQAYQLGFVWPPVAAYLLPISDCLKHAK